MNKNKSELIQEFITLCDMLEVDDEHEDILNGIIGMYLEAWLKAMESEV